MENKIWSYRLYDIAYMVKKLSMPHKLWVILCLKLTLYSLLQPYFNSSLFNTGSNRQNLTLKNENYKYINYINKRIQSKFMQN